MLKNPFFSVILYIALVTSYTVAFAWENNWQFSLLNSSGLGDFLSGLFAPLAFLYLLLGHKQQEEALNRTNQDLLRQLTIQEAMLKLQTEDRKALEFQSIPILNPTIKTSISPLTTYDETKKEFVLDYSVNDRNIEISIENLGSDIFYFNSIIESPSPLQLFNQIKFEKNDSVKFRTVLFSPTFASDKKLKITILNTYVTSLGIHYQDRLHLTLSEDTPTWCDIYGFGPEKIRPSPPTST